jgi:fatty acid synthase subunit beta, fungi type
MRQNYRNLTVDGSKSNGRGDNRSIFPEIGPESEFIIFHSNSGLLSITQFAQLALTLNARATFEDLKARQLVSERFVFAGHSLGEFAALSAVTAFVSIEELASFVFCRGSSAQGSVSRNPEGQSDYRLCAVNPSTIHPGECCCTVHKSIGAYKMQS